VPGKGIGRHEDRIRLTGGLGLTSRAETAGRVAIIAKGYVTTQGHPVPTSIFG